MYRSGDNLKPEAVKFCDQSENVVLYSPFIRVNQLEDLLANVTCDAIIVRWQTTDLLNEVTDFVDLFKFCSDREINLYRNTSMHLKVIRNEKNELLYGSANFTNRGLGNKAYNLELSGLESSPERADIYYLDDIVSKSRIVTQEYFELLKNDIDARKKNYKKVVIVEDIEIQKAIETKFLMSSLPMTFSPGKLWSIYAGDGNGDYTQAELDCSFHDLKFNNIAEGLTEKAFYRTLERSFNANLFIQGLKEQLMLEENRTLGYTQITMWIAANTLTVPTPTRFDVKSDKWVDRLHQWVPVFDHDFWSEKRHPNGSDLLHYRPLSSISHLDLEEFISTLKIDRARGNKAPHQLVLLSSLCEMYDLFGTIEIDPDALKTAFYTIWEEFSGKYPHAKRPNVAMPVNAFSGQKWLSITLQDPSKLVEDYKSETELIERAKKIKMSDRLAELLDQSTVTKESIMEFY